MRAVVAICCGAALAAGGLASPAVGAPAAPSEVFIHRECSWLDFGHGLIRTSALGSPRRAVAGVPQAGVVEVHPDNWSADEPPLVLTSTLLGIQAEPMGHFGAAMVGAQVSFPDYCADLVIGMPGADGGRGAVLVVPDVGSGFDVARAVRLPTSTLGLQPGDALGTAIGVVQSPKGAVIVAGRRVATFRAPPTPGSWCRGSCRHRGTRRPVSPQRRRCHPRRPRSRTRRGSGARRGTRNVVIGSAR